MHNGTKTEPQQIHSTARLQRRQNTGAALLCGVAVSFLCHGFCKPAHCSTFIFFKRQRKKIKELHPPHQQKHTP